MAVCSRGGLCVCSATEASAFWWLRRPRLMPGITIAGTRKSDPFGIHIEGAGKQPIKRSRKH
jgi:hypothetical protein